MKHQIDNVVQYILKKAGPMSAMKLQKLVYYCQAWSLVWDEEQLFNDEIQAWANGPVAPYLYKKHKGQFKITTWKDGDASKLTKKQKETIDAVIKFYGDMNSQKLSDLTHGEQPWINARKGLDALDRGEQTISVADMEEYYSSLPARKHA